jgi:glutamate dehydrogenase
MSGVKNDPASPATEPSTGPATGPSTGKDLAQAFARRLDLKGGPGSGQAAFLSQIAADLEAEELPPVTDDALAAMFADFWRFAEEARDQDPAIRLRPWKDADGRDLGRDLLEIVQNDRPFLVDSIMGRSARPGDVPSRRRDSPRRIEDAQPPALDDPGASGPRRRGPRPGPDRGRRRHPGRRPRRRR